MNTRKLWVQEAILAIAGTALTWGALSQFVPQVGEAQGVTYPTNSSPIAVSTNNAFVWSVNPDADSVSVFLTAADLNVKIAEIAVGKEPWCVALTPDSRKVYVSNMASGTVSVIDAQIRVVTKTITVGTEPFGCALSPNGQKLYVTNQASASVSVINTATDEVVKTIPRVAFRPHAVAVSASGGTVYVTDFLALKRAGDARPLTRSEGADDGREGRVTVINGATDTVFASVALNPIADVGSAFRSDGNTLLRQPISNPPVFDNVSGAFPNLLEAVVIRNGIAYIPNTCSSPNGPFRFNVNVQSCLSTVSGAAYTEAFPTLNMNVGVNFEPVGVKLFNTNPLALAFKRGSPEGFIALAATDRLLRVTLGGNGAPTINPPLNAGDPGNIVRIPLKTPEELLAPDAADTIGGKNPRGVVINYGDTRAYVMDFVSRDVAVVDISGSDPSQYNTLDRMQSTALPAPASVDATVLRGKQLFNSAIGPEGLSPNSSRPAGLLSDTGWGACYSCHPNGLTDTVTWMFADGPRQAISMESTFEFGAADIVQGAPALPQSHQRALNWSAVRDEAQDFERNIRAVSGGGGLITGIPEGTAGLGQVPDLTPVANTGRSADLDAIATYLALGVRAPISPVSSHAIRPQIGRVVFAAAGCQNCHGGKNWTISTLDYTPPPPAQEVSDAQLVRFLCRVGTFDPNLFSDGVSNEIRANNAANVEARGDLGFNVPSLISVYASAPYLHSGAAPTLAAVLENTTHRRAGQAAGFDVLDIPGLRPLLVDFLMSIDRNTEPFLDVSPPANACGPQAVS